MLNELDQGKLGPLIVCTTGADMVRTSSYNLRHGRSKQIVNISPSLTKPGAPASLEHE
jgi:hypothetical protein